MKRFIPQLASILFLVLLASPSVFGQSPYDPQIIQDSINHFKYVQKIPAQTTPIPKPFEISVAVANQGSYLLIDDQTMQPQPFVIISHEIENPVTVTLYGTVSDAVKLVDGSDVTYETLLVEPESVAINSPTTAKYQFNYEVPISPYGLSTILKSGVTPAQRLSIQALNEATLEYDYVLNRAPLASWVAIPTMRSRSFIVTLEFTEPLQISEMNFQKSQDTLSYFLRFPARVNTTYSLYSVPEGQLPYLAIPETSLQLRTEEKIEKISPHMTPNQLYDPEDSDKDNTVDSEDNCVTIKNPNQEDVNSNEVGDACEDFDYDSILNALDNCVDIANPNQQDTDGDEIGDHCDAEESRWIEQFAFLPWLGIGVGFIIVLLLFKSTSGPAPQSMEQSNGESDETK